MLLTLGFSGVLAALIACWIKSNLPPRVCAVFFSVEPIFWFIYTCDLLVAALFYKDYASVAAQ
ncbi:hypothetical protein ACNKHU_25585 [Shigella flexneri]